MPGKKINHDTGMAFGILAFCLFAYWQISELPAGFGEGVIGPSFFPTVMNTVIALLALGLLARSIIRKDRVKSVPKTPRAMFGAMVAFLILLVAYAFLYETLGFFISSGAAMVLGLLLLGERRPLPVLLFSVCVITLAWFGFAKLMKVALPAGTLF